MKTFIPFTTQTTVTNREAIVPVAFAPSSPEQVGVNQHAISAQPFASPRRPRVSPSLRIASTAANRSLLRWLRTAELEAWQDAGQSRRGLKLFSIKN